MESTKGYIFAELDITDADRFNCEYAPRVEPILKKFGATFLIAGGSPDVREGDRTVKRIVLLQFSSPQVAREFYDSAEYQKIVGFRFTSARTHLYILEGSNQGSANAR